jgi:MFS family permease
VAAAWDVWSLTVFRFALGVAVRLDYPIAASYLAEILPSKARGRWLVSAFSLQAFGILLGAAAGVVILLTRPHITSWRIMLGFGLVPALVIIWLRRRVPESPRWLAQNDREQEACEVGRALVGTPVQVTPADKERHEPPPEGLGAFLQPQLFSQRWRRRTIFTAVPWFLMDIATYGVGIFTPTLLASIALGGANTTFIADDIASTKGTALLDAFLAVGFALAILLVDRVGRVPLQLTGFAVMTIALCVLAAGTQLPGGANAHLALVMVGFGLFNTFMNLGPNATTFALPAEVFPSEMRSAGHGFAAECDKLGAALGTSSSRYCWRTSARPLCCTGWPRPVRAGSSSPSPTASSRAAPPSTNSRASRPPNSPHASLLPDRRSRGPRGPGNGPRGGRCREPKRRGPAGSPGRSDCSGSCAGPTPSMLRTAATAAAVRP